MSRDTIFYSMDRAWLRVLVLASVYIVLVAVSGFVLDWFVLGHDGWIAVDLRHINVCDNDRCTSTGHDSAPELGPYVYGAWLTFWGTLVLSSLVVFQAGSRLIAGYARPGLSRMGVLLGMAMLASAAATAFIFEPDPGAIGKVFARDFERTAAPMLLMIAHVVGILTVHHAQETADDDVSEYKLVGLSRFTADRALPAGAPSAKRSAEASPAPSALGEPTTASVPPFPDHLRNRLSFVVLSAELMRGGIDARREDGGMLLVIWRDVVAVSARRLPPALDGETFVDVISIPGSTLRVLAWTQLSGEPLPGAGDARARALVAFVTDRCPDARIDLATREFAENGAPPEQLASVDELATHDAGLA